MNSEGPTPRLERFATYEEACRQFHSECPERFNIARAVCRGHNDAVTRVAIIEVRPAGNNTYTFGALDYFSDKFATVLAGSGIAEGSRVAVQLPQSAALAVAHLGVLKAGGVVVPLKSEGHSSELTLEQIDAGVFVIDESAQRSLGGRLRDLPLRGVFVVSDNIHGHVVEQGARSFWRDIYEASSDFSAVDTNANSEAVTFYSADEPKHLHQGSHVTTHTFPHSALVGSLPAFEMSNSLDVGDDGVFWTPDDWSSAETLLGVIYQAWYYGLAVVASIPVGLNTLGSLQLMDRCGVTSAFLSDEALTLRSVNVDPPAQFDLQLRRIVTTGQATREARAWVETHLAASLNSICIRQSAGSVAATCERWYQTKEGSVGRPVPGRRIEIMDEGRNIALRGERGQVAVQLPDPVLGLARTTDAGESSATRPEWFLTGDFGFKDEEGFLFLSS